MFIRIAATLVICAAPAAAQVTVLNGATESVLPGAKVHILGGGVTVQNGGLLSYVGTGPTSRPQFLGAQGGISIDVQSGGTIDLKFATIENLKSLVVKTGGKIRRIQDTAFVDLLDFHPGTAPWINLNDLVDADRPNIPFSFNRLTFDVPECDSGRITLAAALATPVVRLLGSTSTQWGEAYDSDVYNRIYWHTGAVTRTLPAGTFDTLEDAVKDALTTSSSVITVNLGANAFIDDFVDFNQVPGGPSATGPEIHKACLAPMVATPVSDSDGDTTAEGRIINCVIARGASSETTAYNCTFFDPAAAVPAINNVTGTNLLIESGFTGSGNTFLTTVSTAASTWFVGATGFDFHLQSPAGNAAIDVGGSTSYTTDFEGESRGYDVPGTGSSPHWDVGADEFGQPVIITVSRKTRTMTQPVIQAFAQVGTTVYFYRNGVLLGSAVADSFGVATFTDTTASLDVQYTYRASYLSDSSALSSTNAVITIDTTGPNAPTNCRVKTYHNTIDVEWEASTSLDVVGYRVYRKEGAGSFVLLNTTGVVLGTKYRDSTALNGTSYQYQVTALDDAVNY